MRGLSEARAVVGYFALAVSFPKPYWVLVPAAGLCRRRAASGNARLGRRLATRELSEAWTQAHLGVAGGIRPSDQGTFLRAFGSVGIDGAAALRVRVTTKPRLGRRGGPRDRAGTFYPQLIAKYQRRFPDFVATVPNGKEWCLGRGVHGSGNRRAREDQRA